MKIGLILIILAFSNLFLRIWIVSTVKEKLPEDGYELNIKGKLILAFVGLITGIVIIIADTRGYGYKMVLDCSYSSSNRVSVVHRLEISKTYETAHSFTYSVSPVCGISLFYILI